MEAAKQTMLAMVVESFSVSSLVLPFTQEQILQLVRNLK